MVILHDAVKTIQNLGFLFFSKKKTKQEKLSSFEDESHTTSLTVALELAKALQLTDFNGFLKVHKPRIKI